jgi:hypothetical protein
MKSLPTPAAFGNLPLRPTAVASSANSSTSDAGLTAEGHRWQPWSDLKPQRRSFRNP